ncbi:hypothetical protein WG66_010523 [Moniliophthora roreri]|nr:hypothetical protein WG66_010523 [Moniliophthora roreri]
MGRLDNQTLLNYRSLGGPRRSYEWLDSLVGWDQKIYSASFFVTNGLHFVHRGRTCVFYDLRPSSTYYGNVILME